MKQRLLFFIIGLGISLTPAFGQRDDFNITIQAGYNFGYINPTVFNFTIDSTFIPRNPDNEPQLEAIGWTNGFSGGIGYSRRRASFRLHAHLYEGSTFAIGPDGNGVDTRTDVVFSGASIGIDLSSELIGFGPYFSIGVGTGASLNNFRTALATVPVVDFSESAEIPVISDEWKFGFKLHLPIRVKAPAYVTFSLEPYFMVFFSPVDYKPFNEALNGAATNPIRLFDEMDHFGINASVIFSIFDRS